MNKYQRFIPAYAVAGGLFLVCGSEGLRASLSDRAKPIPYVTEAQNTTTGPVTGNCNSIGGSNNSTCTITAPVRQGLSLELENKLLTAMTRKDKKVYLTIIGGNKDQEIGSDFQVFLEKNGFGVKTTRVGMLVPSPDNKVTLRETNDAYYLGIAPSAQE